MCRFHCKKIRLFCLLKAKITLSFNLPFVFLFFSETYLKQHSRCCTISLISGLYVKEILHGQIYNSIALHVTVILFFCIHTDDDLSCVLIGLHVSVSICNVLQAECAVNHRPQWSSLA